MKIPKITFTYQDNGKEKAVTFNPVSVYALLNNDLSFGLPQKIKDILLRKAYLEITVNAIEYEGRAFVFSGTGYSINGKNLFLHFEVVKPVTKPATTWADMSRAELKAELLRMERGA